MPTEPLTWRRSPAAVRKMRGRALRTDAGRSPPPPLAVRGEVECPQRWEGGGGGQRRRRGGRSGRSMIERVTGDRRRDIGDVAGLVSVARIICRR